MLYCPGDGCPLRADCYRHTQPMRGRDQFAALPFDATTGTCYEFVSNIPRHEWIRETAYFLWLQQGKPEERDEEHWHQAYEQWCKSMGRTSE